VAAAIWQIVTTAGLADDRPAVLVTGATGTLGSPLVRRLRAKDARVTAVARSGESLAKLGGDDAPALLRVAADLVRDEQAANAVVRAHVCAHGRLDAVVHGLGQTVRGSLEMGTAAETRDALVANLLVPIQVTQAALTHLASTARAVGFAATIYVGSIAAMVHPMDQPVYAAAKSGLVGFAVAFRKQAARLGVECVIVSPGSIAAPERHVTRPSSHLLEPDEVAAVLCELALGRRSPDPHIVLEAPGWRD
jgi:NAD(P)-dependent dehydrogenase (short-subunit alcohol dehydrogenase family)